MPAPDAPAAERSEPNRPEEQADPDSERMTLTRSDERVLAYLDGAGTDYPALVASNTGLHASHVEARLRALKTAGLVEQVTGEVLYRVTAAGRNALREDCASWSD